MPVSSRTSKIPLRNRAGEIVAFALVDGDDLARVSKFGSWSLRSDGYVYCTREGTTVYLHRWLLGLECGDPLLGDHKNRNKLDNRKANLRPIARRRSNQNTSSRKGSTSRFRGVHWHVSRKRWVATAKLDDKQHHIGYFLSESDAAKAAKEFRLRHMTGALD